MLRHCIHIFVFWGSECIKIIKVSDKHENACNNLEEKDVHFPRLSLLKQDQLNGLKSSQFNVYDLSI